MGVVSVIVFLIGLMVFMFVEAGMAKGNKNKPRTVEQAPERDLLYEERLQRERAAMRQHAEMQMAQQMRAVEINALQRQAPLANNPYANQAMGLYDQALHVRREYDGYNNRWVEEYYDARGVLARRVIQRDFVQDQWHIAGAAQNFGGIDRQRRANHALSDIAGMLHDELQEVAKRFRQAEPRSEEYRRLQRRYDKVNRMWTMLYEPIYHPFVTVLDNDAEHGALVRVRPSANEHAQIVHLGARRPSSDIAFLAVRCPSTKHAHILFVPPEMKTAKQARAWTFYMTPEEFAPVKET